ncbi:MAG: hypothetical protein MI919_05315 [Holophagales bacterium]|nr:hypothetical protein [Holophagales bacterium]
MNTLKWISIAIALAMVGTSSFAQSSVRIEAEPVDCLPISANGLAWAKVENNVPDTDVRLYFRRMHDAVEDLYWVPMRPAGDGRYWGVFPKAEDRMVQRHELIETRQEAQQDTSWASWWREKDRTEHRNPNSDLDQDLIRERASQGKSEARDWLAEMDDATFQRWLEQLENEPTEYFTSIYDWRGQRLAKSPTRVAEVRDNCRVELSEAQLGEAQNLTVGETAYWQRGEELFHWLCDGIVSRIDPTNVKRGDGICRACVVAWWKRPAVLIPAASAVGVGAAISLIDDDDPAPISPSDP